MTDTKRCESIYKFNDDIWGICGKDKGHSDDHQLIFEWTTAQGVRT